MAGTQIWRASRVGRGRRPGAPPGVAGVVAGTGPDFGCGLC